MLFTIDRRPARRYNLSNGAAWEFMWTTGRRVNLHTIPLHKIRGIS
jgi:hypothetical protein